MLREELREPGGCRNLGPRGHHGRGGRNGANNYRAEGQKVHYGNNRGNNNFRGGNNHGGAGGPEACDGTATGVATATTTGPPLANKNSTMGRSMKGSG